MFCQSENSDEEGGLYILHELHGIIVQCYTAIVVLYRSGDEASFRGLSFL